MAGTGQWGSAGNSNELLIKPIFHRATFVRTEQQPTDSESSALLRPKPTHQRLDFLCHPSVTPQNPPSFSRNLPELAGLTGLVRHQNEAQPRPGLMHSTF
jgi:hypothetical protein